MRLSSWFPTRAVTAFSLVVSACGVEADPFVSDTEALTCEPDVATIFPTLAIRAGPPAVSTGEVPHQQIDAESTPELIEELTEKMFSLSILERRPTTLALTGTALWLTEDIPLSRPECVPGGREFAHIHIDGNMHTVLPHGPVEEAVSAGWADPHPFAGVRPGFETFVLLFTPRSSEEIDVMFQLIVEAINFITGG